MSDEDFNHLHCANPLCRKWFIPYATHCGHECRSHRRSDHSVETVGVTGDQHTLYCARCGKPFVPRKVFCCKRCWRAVRGAPLRPLAGSSAGKQKNITSPGKVRALKAATPEQLDKLVQYHLTSAPSTLPDEMMYELLRRIGGVRPR